MMFGVKLFLHKGIPWGGILDLCSYKNTRFIMFLRLGQQHSGSVITCMCHAYHGTRPIEIMDTVNEHG